MASLTPPTPLQLLNPFAAWSRAAADYHGVIIKDVLAAA
jgi:hypothetical protein